MKLALLALALLPTLGDEPSKDVVALNGGQKVEGRVVYQDAAVVIVRVGSREREIAMKDVANVTSRAVTHQSAMERWLALDPADGPGLLALMDWCNESNLRENAELLAWRALANTPNEQRAHELLGHELRDERWVVRAGAKRVEWERLPKLRSSWGDAWQLDTTHYRLRTNTTLKDATELAMTLECLYRSFYGLFAAELRLYEITEPMRADVHADKASFPELTGMNRAYFDPSEHKLIVDASVAIDAYAVMHEATHQLLDATALNTRGMRGAIPAWLDEGLAEYVKNSSTGGAGRWRYDKTTLWLQMFKLHAESKDPYDLSRLLTFESADFLASSNINLKYAQAYTLVHFMMHGRESKYRAGFMTFLRAAYKGQASMTDFKDALRIRERDFEKEWIAYVRQVAAQ